MCARWSVLLGVVGGLAASGAAVGASVSAPSGRTSTDPVVEVAGRKGNPPSYRYIFSSESAQTVVASHGWNLLDVSSQASADQLLNGRQLVGIPFANKRHRAARAPRARCASDAVDVGL